MEGGTNHCADGYTGLTTADQCVAYAEYRGLPYVYAFTDIIYPKGCYINNNQLLFNEHPTGSSNGDRRPICEPLSSSWSSTPSGAPTFAPYLVMEGGTNHCADGYTGLTTADQCVAYAEYRGLSYGYAFTDSIQPKGCYINNNQLFFNEHPTGSSNGDRRPICERLSSSWSSSPSAEPTSSPTPTPTSSPTNSPTASPTGRPTSSPTGAPTSSPTAHIQLPGSFKSCPSFMHVTKEDCAAAGLSLGARLRDGILVEGHWNQVSFGCAIPGGHGDIHYNTKTDATNSNGYQPVCKKETVTLSNSLNSCPGSTGIIKEDCAGAGLSEGGSLRSGNLLVEGHWGHVSHGCSIQGNLGDIHYNTRTDVNNDGTYYPVCKK